MGMGIHLPMHRVQVWSLVQEDSTYRGATKPIHPTPEPLLQSPGATTNERRATTMEALRPQSPSSAIREATTMKLESSSPSTAREKPTQSKEDPAQAKSKKKSAP